MRVPGETFPLPIEAPADRLSLRYQWVRAADSSAVTADTAVAGGTVIAPTRPGLYHLALRNDANRIVIGDVLVGVLVPFAEKLGNTLNGYRIGRYRFERARGDATPPPKGFVEVWPEDVGLYPDGAEGPADLVAGGRRRRGGLHGGQHLQAGADVAAEHTEPAQSLPATGLPAPGCGLAQ